ncbi:hypothetical protein OF83DRAFT_1173016 [Amylostereum chailletii]|nr:hypothetical protein OF83DRAFT_1173016 [Amylostereum chailletii]
MRSTRHLHFPACTVGPLELEWAAINVRVGKEEIQQLHRSLSLFPPPDSTSRIMLFSAGLISLFLGTLAIQVQAKGPRTQCVETVNAKAGESCQSLSSTYYVPIATIEGCNPNLDCDNPFTTRTPVCLRQYTPPCTVDVPASETTCQSLIYQWKITQSQFVQMNDDVDDACDNLVIGQQYCVSTDYCVANPSDPICNS